MQRFDEELALRGFVREGRVIQLPARRTKRLVVLSWLARRFEPGRTYAEREVNAMLADDQPDHATLRRLLVDEGFLERERGSYRRR
jgi:hypothetical protein